MKIFLRRNWMWVTLILSGVLIWYLSAISIGEHYATAVGPDYLLKIGIALVRLGVAWALQRLMMMWYFTTVYDWTSRGDKPQSDFTRTWKGLAGGHDPRIGWSLIAHLGTWLIASLISLFAA